MPKITDYLPGMMLIGLNEDAAIANARGLVFRNVPNVVTVTNGATYTYRFNVNIYTKLLERILTVISGHVRYEVIVGASESAAGTPIALSTTNNHLGKSPVNTMRGGVTVSGGTVVDTVEIITGQGGNTGSLPDAQIGGRILAKNQVFWLRITGLASSSSVILNLLLHEYQDTFEP